MTTRSTTPTPARRTRRTRENLQLAAAVSLAALCLLTTACTAGGGKDTGSASADSGSEEGKKADQALAHRKCLREQGLNVPEPKPGEEGVGLTIGGDGVSKEKMEKAFKACRDKGGAGMGKEPTQADKDKMVKYAQCMRKNGFDMPDPTFGEGGSMSAAKPIPQGAEMRKFEKANKACESVSR